MGGGETSSLGKCDRELEVKFKAWVGAAGSCEVWKRQVTRSSSSWGTSICWRRRRWIRSGVKSDSTVLLEKQEHGTCLDFPNAADNYVGLRQVERKVPRGQGHPVCLFILCAAFLGLCADGISISICWMSKYIRICQKEISKEEVIIKMLIKGT